MNLYEHTIIARQDTSPSEIKQLTEKYSKIVEKNDGVIVKTENWGLINLSYLIKKNKKGSFIHFKIKGKGNVVRRMFSDQIDADYFVMIDGDNTYDVSKLNKMLELMEQFNYDMIVGKRVHKDSQAYRKGHIIGNKFFFKFRKLILW